MSDPADIVLPKSGVILRRHASVDRDWSSDDFRARFHRREGWSRAYFDDSWCDSDDDAECLAWLDVRFLRAGGV